MIYITGDMHGNIERLYDREWRKLKKGDTLIVCGDLGYLWAGGKEEEEVIKYLGSRKFTVAFVEGTHDNLQKINRCRTTYWKGGMVHRIEGNLLHLMRGQVFNIEDTKIFTFGGGESLDKDMRLENNLWWREEMPTPAQMTGAAKQLDDLDCKVDYIITHEPPSLVKSAMLLRRGLADRVNKLNGFFEEINENCSFKHWYFGSLHEDRLVTPKHTCVFGKVLPIDYYINNK
ncbi:MAG: metallophosphoesterase [Clostridia bacterium]|nr:metallophosphoesterase [Clostridia bacterium]